MVHANGNAGAFTDAATQRVEADHPGWRVWHRRACTGQSTTWWASRPPRAVWAGPQTVARATRGELRARLAPVFCQARSRLAAFGYIGALVTAAGERRSCWQLAEAAGHATPRRMQALLAEHAWDWQEALGALQRLILDHLADPQAGLGVGETPGLKQGR